MPIGDRPSIYGKYLGDALVIIAREGRKTGAKIPEPCLTCAFRPDTLPNQCAGTGMVALNCVIGADDSHFACHHGMEDGGEPQKVCAGYVAAKLAPYGFTKSTIAALHASLPRIEGDDHVRADYDAWATTIDPEGKMDVYQLARAYAGRTRK